ncbi:MAG: 7-cyano-7-deazaguanine synthase [Alphaproteobacteria bacterium MarineAlpha9_Bin4]|nr:7-cyano-7-deazaguanine synthase QueC [Pelagibacterales bacterium]PPR27514.1 MAG: 7-cyano-7-deazaguanine synthase [Alphaproteobacteria bacterium MarineAlpha9_Bin4]|tara:strand:+ start:64 stop:771 length:708 start_codon:yes stop_codon:yes gene_type:complete
MKKRAILLFSGGQDSTTALGWCLKNFNTVDLLSFDYGQRHSVELKSAKNIIREIEKDFSHHKNKIRNSLIFKIKNLSNITKSSLTSNIKIDTSAKIPNTFVPGRNLLFYNLAATYAYTKDIDNIVSGVCQTDYSGYPDCRDATIKMLNKAINLGMEKKFTFHTPLMFLTKAETWKLSYSIGGNKFVNIIKKLTHTCYKGERRKLFSWGYGCNRCPACLIRKKGWEEYNLEKKNDL